MAQELAINSFYQSLRDKNWVDSNICCALGSEFWLSELLFKGDRSRVLYSKDDICFRRRIETLGKGDVADDGINYVNLDLPYACYSQNGPYEADDRSASMNSAAAIKGQYQVDTGVILKFMPAKIKYTATAFFSRRDDVNVASQLLYWESNPKGPLYFMVHHQIAGQPIDIPVFMTIESFDSNTDYQEKKWLTDSKIFPIKIEYTIRTYQTLIETVGDGAMMMPLRWSGMYGYNNQNGRVYLTQNTTLMWADDKFSKEELDAAIQKEPAYLDQDGPQWFPGMTAIVDPNIEKIAPIANYGKLYNLETKDLFPIELQNTYILIEECEQELQRLHLLDPTNVDEIKAIEAEIAEAKKKIGELELQRPDTDEVNTIVEEAVKGYFTEDSNIYLDEYSIISKTENSMTVGWKMREDQLKNFEYLRVYIPGVCHEKITDPLINEYLIKDLYPGSEYKITLILKNKAGEVTYRLIDTTAGEKVFNGNLLANLVGKTFTQRN
jgi:hypothetical protein